MGLSRVLPHFTLDNAVTLAGKNNGSGIFVINSPGDIPDTEESILVQRYIANPYLIK